MTNILTNQEPVLVLDLSQDRSQSSSDSRCGEMATVWTMVTSDNITIPNTGMRMEER